MKKYSGLKDKNGIKIYDGDEIMFQQNSNAWDIYGESFSKEIKNDLKFCIIKSKVYFKDGKFMINPPRISTLLGACYNLCDVNRDCEITKNNE